MQCGKAGAIVLWIGSFIEKSQSELKMAVFYGQNKRGCSFPDAAPAGSFIRELARSSKTLEVGSDQTVLAALADAGVEVPSSCEVGVCGTCVTRVIDGIPDHQDSFLTDEEHTRNDCFTPCCSRAKTPKLVVDL